MLRFALLFFFFTTAHAACSDKSVSVQGDGYPNPTLFMESGVEGTYTLGMNDCASQPEYTGSIHSTLAAFGCIKSGSSGSVMYNNGYVEHLPRPCGHNGYQCIERCHDTSDPHWRDSGDVSQLFDGTPGIFSLNREECLALTIGNGAVDYTEDTDGSVRVPYGCSLAVLTNGNVYFAAWNGHFPYSISCGTTYNSYKYNCVERYQSQFGCTNTSAFNYLGSADVDDGSCMYITCESAKTDYNANGCCSDPNGAGCAANKQYYDDAVNNCGLC